MFRSSQALSRAILRTTRSSRSFLFATKQHSILSRQQQQLQPRLQQQQQQQYLACLSRAFSSSGEKTEAKQEKPKGGDDQNDDMKEIVLTPGEKVVAASRLTMWAGIAAFASVCAYYIARELIPTKMSPNRVFDRSYEVVRNDPEVKRRYGDTLKAYGRDHGGHREGRRNFIEHTEYTDQQDGSKRTRVRYNLEGRFGNAFVFAEVSADMPSGEFVYILVQDKANGRVHTVIDNRAALTAKHLAGGDQQANSAMAQLLSGSGGGK